MGLELARQLGLSKEKQQQYILAQVYEWCHYSEAQQDHWREKRSLEARLFGGEGEPVTFYTGQLAELAPRKWETSVAG